MVKLQHMKLSAIEKFFLAALITLSIILIILYLHDSEISHSNFKYNNSYVRLSNNSILNFELIPDTIVVYEGYSAKLPPSIVSINHDGFRDRDFSLEKSEHTFRIIALGDSFTIGEAINISMTYPKVLEKKLNENKKDFNYEVLNFGVGAYSTYQEIELLKQKGLKYHPDIVLVGYLPNDIENITRVSELKQVLVWEYKQKNITFTIWDYKIHEEAFTLLHNEMQNMSFEEAFAIVKQPLDELYNISKENNLSVMIVYFPAEEFLYGKEQLDALKNISAERNWCFLDLTPIYEQKNLLKEVVSYPLDRHPNAYAYSIIADEIYKRIVECNLLPE